MYMDDIKLNGKNEKELKTLIHVVRIYCQDIGMEFALKNVPCHASNEKVVNVNDGIELPN